MLGVTPGHTGFETAVQTFPTKAALALSSGVVALSAPIAVIRAHTRLASFTSIQSIADAFALTSTFYA